MNDSFLEDLELVPTVEKVPTQYPADRHVTTRAVTSTPLQPEPKLDDFVQRRSGSKQSSKDPVRDTRKPTEPKKATVKLKVPERKERPVETKLKPVENKVRFQSKESTPKDESRSKVLETRVRVGDNQVLGKDRTRRSGSYASQSSDVSSKENSRPSDSSKDSVNQIDNTKEKSKKCDCGTKKSDMREKDPVALLNAIKDLVSTYTKQESTKILRAMQELHINSQANLVKNLLCQTDELVKEIQPDKNVPKVKMLTVQNDRLQDDVLFLKKQNEDLKRQNDELHKRLEEFEVLKQENITMKLKFKEFLK